ncbi:MAG: hypothetical protein R3213_10220, partial [Flavobacteriaceae bacterium]|nr:hypothetical protein [Flavobacteriaceae bacterium]
MPTEPEHIFNTLINIFREKLSLYSATDLQIKKDEIDQIQNEDPINMDCEWKKLKPRTIKTMLIMNFVNKIREERGLTIKQAKSLLHTIQLAFQFKKLNSDDIVYKDREIKEINGLVYDEEKKV